MKNLQMVAVGADPEAFFKTLDNVPQSAEGIVPGTKNEPHALPALGKGYFIQLDNVSAEYNIPPCSSAKDFNAAIAKGVKYLDTMAKKRKLVLAIEPALHFPWDQVLTPHALTLGCEPDFNVWTKEMNPRPIPPKTLRTAAGHVHVSWKSPRDEDRLLLGRAFDVTLGIPSLLVTKPSERRSLYGKAGCVRMKEYGIEYRTLDNFWIEHKQYREHVFKAIQGTFNLVNEQDNLFADLLEDFGPEIQRCINTHDVDLAIELIDIFAAPTFPVLRAEK